MLLTVQDMTAALEGIPFLPDNKGLKLGNTRTSPDAHLYSNGTDLLLALAATASFNIDGPVEITRAGIAATSTDGLLLANDTAATTGVTVQMTPRIRWHGEAMRTGAGEARQTHDWIAEVLPVTAAGADTYSTLVIKSSFVGGAFAERMSISTSGVLYVPSNINTPTIRSSAGTLVLQSASLGLADSAIEMATGTWTHSSGEGVAVETKPTFNASGTAECVCRKVNPTVTALGSGGLFMDKFMSGKGGECKLQLLTEEVTVGVGAGIGSAGVDSATNLFPASSVILSVTARVTQAAGGGATIFHVCREDTVGNADELLADIAIALGTTGTLPTNGDGTHAGPFFQAAADKATVTTDADVTTADLKVRLEVWALVFVAPTS